MADTDRKDAPTLLSTHDHGNCELCDQIEVESAARLERIGELERELADAGADRDRHARDVKAAIEDRTEALDRAEKAATALWEEKKKLEFCRAAHAELVRIAGGLPAAGQESGALAQAQAKRAAK